MKYKDIETSNDYKNGDLVYVWVAKDVVSEAEIIDNTENPIFKIRYRNEYGLILEGNMPHIALYRIKPNNADRVMKLKEENNG